MAELINRILRWLLRPVLDDMRAMENRVVEDSNRKTDHLHDLLTLQENRLQSTQSLLKLCADVLGMHEVESGQLAVPVITCPICGTEYDVLKSVPASAKQVTIVCSNNFCRQQIEAYRDEVFGWARPKLMVRE